MPAATQFLIVSAGRTGSNLLRSLIESHPAAFCGGEIFNKDYVDRDGVPWPVQGPLDPELSQLMHQDPAEYWRRLVALAAPGRAAVGAKLTYENGAAHPAAAEFFAADRRIRCIHLKRRNLLRVFLSLERARATGQWMARGDAPPPPVALDLQKTVHYFFRHKELEAKADTVLATHPMLEIYYEDLAADPVGVGRRCVEFLGLDPNVPLRTQHKKSGKDGLREAIKNYDELRAAFGEWFGFFDE